MWKRVKAAYEAAVFVIGMATAAIFVPVMIFALLYVLLWSPYCLLFGCGPSWSTIDANEGG